MIGKYITRIELVFGLRFLPSEEECHMPEERIKMIRKFTNRILKSVYKNRQCQMVELADKLQLKKRCSKCGKDKLITNFSYRSTEARYESGCLDCSAKRKKTKYKQVTAMKKRRTNTITINGAYTVDTGVKASKEIEVLLNDLILEEVLR